MSRVEGGPPPPPCKNHYDSEKHGTIGYVESIDMPPIWGKTPMTGLYRKPIVKTIKLSIFQFSKENNIDN